MADGRHSHREMMEDGELRVFRHNFLFQTLICGLELMRTDKQTSPSENSRPNVYDQRMIPSPRRRLSKGG